MTDDTTDTGTGTRAGSAPALNMPNNIVTREAAPSTMAASMT